MAESNTMNYIIAGIIGIMIGAGFVAYRIGKSVCQKCKADPNYNVCTDLNVDTTLC